MKQPVTTPYTPIDPRVLAAVTASTGKLWPGLPVIPAMDTGASDGIYLIRSRHSHLRRQRHLQRRRRLPGPRPQRTHPGQKLDDDVDFIYDLITRLASW